MMRVLFFFILSLISVSFVQSVPCKICAYQGANAQGKFKLEDVPEQCEAILYGGNFMNIAPPQADADAITALKKAGKTVYMLYLYGNDDAGANLWSLADPKNLQNVDQYMTPMTSFLTTNKIDGVFFGFLGIKENSPPCYDVSINDFITKVKNKVSSIKVGLILNGYQANQWNKHYYDFTVTNANVDFYVIDATTAGNSCTKKTRAIGGLTPLTTNDRTVTSLTEMCKYTTSSKMDQNKVLINVIDSAYMGGSGPKSVSEYCLGNSNGVWCIDSIELIHQQVKVFKETFKGMILSYLDTDDMDNSCKCEKYPLANAYFDAWENKPVKCCDAIS